MYGKFGFFFKSKKVKDIFLCFRNYISGIGRGKKILYYLILFFFVNVLLKFYLEVSLGRDVYIKYYLVYMFLVCGDSFLLKYL